MRDNYSATDDRTGPSECMWEENTLTATDEQILGKYISKNYKMHNKNNIEAICHIHSI